MFRPRGIAYRRRMRVALSLFRLFPVLLLATFLLFKQQGPTRLVKRLVAAELLLFAVVMSLVQGALFVFGWLGALVALQLVLMSFTTLSWRARARRAVEDVPHDWCPEFALQQVYELTNAYQALGFAHVRDGKTVWRAQGTDRVSYTRFMRHESGGSWVEIFVTPDPRAVSWSIKSVIEPASGYRSDAAPTLVATSDKMMNHEVLPDPCWVVNRIRGGSTPAEAVERHAAFCASLGRAPRTVDDPVAASREAHEAWVRAVVESGQARLDGEWLAIRPARVLPINARILLGWLQ